MFSANAFSHKASFRRKMGQSPISGGIPVRSIAIMNQKGGVGKTTTAVNVAAALAATGQRVCLIDLDPQAHATIHFGIEPNPETPSIYDVLTDDKRLADVRREVAQNLWVVGSDLDLAAAEIELTGVVGREIILREKLAEDDLALDYLIIDCPPSLGILTVNALAAVDEVFIPLQPHFLALHGLSRLLDTIDLIARRINSRLKLGGVVLCMYDSSTRLAAEVTSDVEEFFRQARGQATPWADARTFQTRIRRNIRLAEAPSFGQSIFQYAPTSNGAEDYRCLAREIAAGAESPNAPGSVCCDS
jgi:chromosome partitioning protein